MAYEWLIDLIKEWVLSLAYATEVWVLEWITPIYVSGALDPDATCTYHKAGTHNDKPYYIRDDGSYFIWWGILDRWIISDGLGSTINPYFERLDSNIIGAYQPKIGAVGVATTAYGYGCPHRCFINRGDPANFDYILGNFTTDGAWHDLDLSAVVPAGTKGISGFCGVLNFNVNKSISFRRNGNANERAISSLNTQAGGILATYDIVVAVDADRKIEYKTSVGGWLGINLCIKAWWY